MEQNPSWQTTFTGLVRKLLHLLWNPEVHRHFTRARKWNRSWKQRIQSAVSHPISLPINTAPLFTPRSLTPLPFTVCRLKCLLQALPPPLPTLPTHYLPQPPNFPWSDYPNKILWIARFMNSGIWAGRQQSLTVNNCVKRNVTIDIIHAFLGDT
jgi:hypothetical protein